MKGKFFSKTIICIAVVFLILNSAVFIQAMGRRPSAKKDKQPEEIVPPEIEIITKPASNIRILTPEGQKLEVRDSVQPAEVLPTVKEDPTKRGQKYKVSDIQTALSSAGFDPGLIDDKMGPKTKKAVRDFQKVNNLVVDGIVGLKTWSKLKPYLNQTKKKAKN